MGYKGCTSKKSRRKPAKGNSVRKHRGYQSRHSYEPFRKLTASRLVSGQTSAGRAAKRANGRLIARSWLQHGSAEPTHLFTAPISNESRSMGKAASSQWFHSSLSRRERVRPRDLKIMNRPPLAASPAYTTLLQPSEPDRKAHNRSILR